MLLEQPLKVGKCSDRTKTTKTTPNNKHTTRTKHNTGSSPESETVKQALSDVDLALGTSLPATSSAVLLDALLFEKDIFPSSFTSSGFFECVVFGSLIVISSHALHGSLTKIVEVVCRDEKPRRRVRAISWSHPCISLEFLESVLVSSSSVPYFSSFHLGSCSLCWLHCIRNTVAAVASYLRFAFPSIESLP